MALLAPCYPWWRYPVKAPKLPGAQSHHPQGQYSGQFILSAGSARPRALLTCPCGASHVTRPIKTAGLSVGAKAQ